MKIHMGKMTNRMDHISSLINNFKAWTLRARALRSYFRIRLLRCKSVW